MGRKQIGQTYTPAPHLDFTQAALLVRPPPPKPLVFALERLVFLEGRSATGCRMASRTTVGDRTAALVQPRPPQ